MKTSIRVFTFGAALWLAPAGSNLIAQDEVPCDCTRDLEAVAEFLKRDYAGYFHAERTLGKKPDAALAAARKATKGASGAECDAAIRGYLKAFADGHLGLQSKFSPTVDMPPPIFYGKREPLARVLSDDAFLLRFPSFAISYKKDIEALLEKHKSDINSRELLIVDIRGNGGGADSAWTEIIAPIYANPMKRWNVQWRPTKGNADAIEEQVRQVRANGNSSPAVESFQKIADGMRAHLKDELAPLGPRMRTMVTLPEVWPLPRRVAILVDGFCVSSGENFLLAARQSSKVTVFGAATYGAVDFQNIRMAKLPSGDRQLMFAMSVSERVVELKQRQLGISPDKELPEKLLGDPEGAIEHILAAMTAKTGVTP